MSRSQVLFQQAKKLIPGGVNSPVRACAAVGAEPLFIASASCGKITRLYGDTYVDFVQPSAPMLLAHALPKVPLALQSAPYRVPRSVPPLAAAVPLAD